MISPKEDGAGRVDTALPTPPPSAGVQLEVAILGADHDALEPAPSPTDERPHRSALVVAAEADLRRYVRECLRERTDVLLLEAETIAAALVVMARESPTVLIVDEREGAILMVPSRVRAILLVDAVPRWAPPDARVRLLARPFSADQLLAEVDRLLE